MYAGNVSPGRDWFHTPAAYLKTSLDAQLAARGVKYFAYRSDGGRKQPNLPFRGLLRERSSIQATRQVSFAFVQTFVRSSLHVTPPLHFFDCGMFHTIVFQKENVTMVMSIAMF